MGWFYNVYISLYKIYDNSNNINIYNVVKKYIGLPIFKKKPIGRYGPQKISWNHCHRMSWATHVKIQNLGLADTCSPSGKKWYQLDPRANWIKEGAGGTTEEAHQERFFFFSGWLSMAFFTCLCTIQLVFLASQSVVDQQPIFWAGQPTETSTRFFIKPQKQHYYACFEAKKLQQGLSGGEGKIE